MDEVDPVQALQNALSALGSDDALCVGFAVVAEWVEPDGETTLQVIHSPMPPWHLYGLLAYGVDASRSEMLPVHSHEDGDDESDDF